MTFDERIVSALKEHLEERSGNDYYDYSGNVHWYGDEEALKKCAEALLKFLD
jgi:hypothetical protein